MNRFRLSLFALLLATTVGLLIFTSAATTASASTLHPRSITNGVCCSTGSVAALRVRDQSGTQDTQANYVNFTTPGHIYRGYRTYVLPGTISRSSVLSMQVIANYKGPAVSGQVWTWSVWNWGTSTWTRIGGNGAARANTWSVLTFTVSNPRLYIKTGTREVRVRLASNNDLGDAKLDYEAVLLTYGSTPAPTPTRGPSPDISGCTLFPADSVWNTPVDTLPVDSNSSSWINSIGANSPSFHMDFGSGTWDGGPIGIPYNVLDGTLVNKHTVQFTYADESDPGPYPIPANPAREWGSDHHILVVDTHDCTLYELFNATNTGGTWSAGSGAIWSLSSNALRPAGWTSADAAGLPILPGLVRYQEVQAALMQADPAQEMIHHALRFTAGSTNSYIWPGRHLTSGKPNTLTNTPPMGARFRLKAGYNISGFAPEMQVLLRTMQTYGIILADNGTSWMVSGAPDERWNNDMLHTLDVLHGSNFEAVDESCLMVNKDSGQANLSKCP